MKINSIFSAFVVSDYLLEIDNIILENYAHELQKKDDGVIKSNFLGWQSDILTTPNSEINLLVNLILERLNSCKETLGFKKDTIVYLNNLWININGKCSFNRPHIHPQAIFSGVYYIKSNKNNGNLIFKHPSVAHQYDLNESTLERFTEYNAGTWSILPEAGKLIIFPSWLEHYVEPNTSDEERISIAFNAQIRNNS